MLWFFGCEACGILVPWLGIEPAPSALDGKVLTTGPSDKSSTDARFISWSAPSCWESIVGIKGLPWWLGWKRICLQCRKPICLYDLDNPRLLWPWDFLGKDTRAGCHSQALEFWTWTFWVWILVLPLNKLWDWRQIFLKKWPLFWYPFLQNRDGDFCSLLG